jgi:hypothetical protein
LTGPQAAVNLADGRRTAYAPLAEFTHPAHDAHMDAMHLHINRATELESDVLTLHISIPIPRRGMSVILIDYVCTSMNVSQWFRVRTRAKKAAKAE